MIDVPRPTTRPPVIGRNQAVASGHPLASLIAMRILDRGGNAVDAGVAAGIALEVLQPDIVQFSGVAPIIMYLADRREVVTISGLGRWPRKASLRFFERNTGGQLPPGVLRSVVPASLDAWLTALGRYGTLSFADVASPAMELAREGFAVTRLLHEVIAEQESSYARWPQSAAVFLPDGRVPLPGERFRQPDLARTIERLIEAEGAASGGLDAVRGTFYEGPIAAEIDDFYARNGGLLSAADLREFRVGLEPALSTDFNGYRVFSCGPWCQGPMLLEFLNLVEQEDLRGLGHNSVQYVHRVTELMKLGFADREAYFGDPEFVDVPIAELTSKAYAQERWRQLMPDRAWPDMPPPGRLREGSDPAGRAAVHGRNGSTGDAHLDTTYLCVIDRHGNGFSATPSDGSYNCPVVPGLGMVVSTRGSQSWLTAGHPSVVEPWKRPRLTPNPALVFKNDRLFMVIGSPGGDVQCQAMLQVLLNIIVFGMNPQQAIDAARFSSTSFPSSFYPHDSHPGQLLLDEELAPHAQAMSELGHQVEVWPHCYWRGGGVCAIVVDPEQQQLVAGADPRRECYALAW